MTLTALQGAGLLHLHSADRIHRAILSSECVSCRGFGGFLFLPTCERVCFECLDQNHGLHMLEDWDAMKIFGLTRNHMGEIPVIESSDCKRHRLPSFFC
jgi:hypothetical protein